jgi:hypothetical protein
MAIPANCLSPPTTTTYIALACIMVLVGALAFGLIWYLRRLERRQWQHWQREAERWQREAELRHQLWELEQQIREEGLPEEERRRLEQYRQPQAAIKAEARRRLGLPEEALHADDPPPR